MIGSLISLQLTISRSDLIPRTILLRSDHDPGDLARYVDRCWIRNFITTIDHFISNIIIVEIYKLPGNICWNIVCLVSTVCIFSMALITYTYLSNMACPNRVVSWATTVCVHWTGHDALESAVINDVATPPIVTSWIDIISLTIFIQSRARNFNSKFPSEWLCHDSIGNELSGFIFSRSHEPIVIGVCGMRSADQDYRIGFEPIASESLLESGPGRFSLNFNPSSANDMTFYRLYHTWVWNRGICMCVIVRPRSHMLIVLKKVIPDSTRYDFA